jgi:hypothetical protein
MRELCHAGRSGERERSMKRDEHNKTRSLRAGRARGAATPGFAIQITPDTDLGNAMLIVEDEEGHYEPINLAASISEGREMAAYDLRSRQSLLGPVPLQYKLWARGLGGVHRIAATWNVTEL